MASRPVVRGVGLAIVVVVLTGLLALVATRDEGVPAAGARVSVDGRATVVHVDGSTDVLSSGDVVRAGEEVRADAGSFVLELADGGAVEGRAGFDDAPDTRVVVGERPELVAGDLLLLGGEGLDIDAAGTVVALSGADGAARVDRGLAVRAAAYRGVLAVDSAGQDRSVPPLRQLGIASLGRPPGSAEPLLVDEVDPWDRRYLGAAIDLGRRLDAVSASFSGGAPPGASRSVTLFETAYPDLAGEGAFADKLRSGPERPAGEVLVGAVITALGTEGSFPERWEEVFDFRTQGAGWGLVATDQALDDGPVLSAVESAIDRGRASPEVAAPTLPGAGTGTGGGAGTGGGGEGGDGGTGTTLPPGTGDDPTPTSEPAAPTPTLPPTTTPPAPTPTLPPPTLPPPTLPPPEEPLPDTGVPVLDDLIEPVEDLLGGLLGG